MFEDNWSFVLTESIDNWWSSMKWLNIFYFISCWCLWNISNGENGEQWDSIIYKFTNVLRWGSVSDNCSGCGILKDKYSS